jgi:hypothetical protein
LSQFAAFWQFAGIVPHHAGSFAVRIRTRLITDPLVGQGEIPPQFGAARPARKRNPMSVLRKLREQFSRRQTVVSRSEFLILTNKKGTL